MNLKRLSFMFVGIAIVFMLVTPYQVLAATTPREVPTDEPVRRGVSTPAPSVGKTEYGRDLDKVLSVLAQTRSEPKFVQGVKVSAKAATVVSCADILNYWKTPVDEGSWQEPYDKNGKCAYGLQPADPLLRRGAQYVLLRVMTSITTAEAVYLGPDVDTFNLVLGELTPIKVKTGTRYYYDAIQTRYMLYAVPSSFTYTSVDQKLPVPTGYNTYRPIVDMHLIDLAELCLLKQAGILELGKPTKCTNTSTGYNN